VSRLRIAVDRSVSVEMSSAFLALVVAEEDAVESERPEMGSEVVEDEMEEEAPR
jgi:hypothetical protein